MNKKMHATWLLFGCLALTQASAQSAAASAPETRAQVKSETRSALKKGDITRASEGSQMEAPPAQAHRPKKRKKAAAKAASAS